MVGVFAHQYFDHHPIFAHPTIDDARRNRRLLYAFIRALRAGILGAFGLNHEKLQRLQIKSFGHVPSDEFLFLTALAAVAFLARAFQHPFHPWQVRR